MFCELKLAEWKSRWCIALFTAIQS